MNLFSASVAAFFRHPISSVSVLALGGVLIYYRQVVVRPSTLHCKNATKFHRFLLETLPILKENYWPPVWCFEARLQTVMATVTRNALMKKVTYKRKILTLKDGGQVALDFLDRSKHRLKNKMYGGPIVLILPGLTGSSQSDYINSLINVTSKDLEALYVVFNYRGRGGLRLTTPRTYNATNTDDLEEVLDSLCHSYPKADILAVGISLGGVILGHYLSKFGERAKKKLLAAFLISVCFNAQKGTESLERPFFNLYLNRNLAHNLVHAIKQEKDMFANSKFCHLEEVFTSTTIREFDSRFTAPAFGYKTLNDYYDEATLAGKLKHVRIPVLALQANDDPFQPGEATPTEEATKTNHVAIITTEYGGHIGFMEGFLGISRLYYSDRVFEQFARSVIQNNNAMKDM